MQNTTTQMHVVIWKSLRTPFILPAMAQHHCEWENIDMGVLGCRVCGTVHVCNFMSCKNVLETNEGTVCELSGIVIHNKKYSDTEYMDTLVLSQAMPVCTDDFDAQIESAVAMMLLGPIGNRTRRTLMSAQLLILSRNMKDLDSVVSSCMHFFKKVAATPYLSHFMPATRRSELVCDATKDCVRLIRIMLSTGMNIKVQEVLKITVGLLYLMRSGVLYKKIVILSKRSDLRTILPPENVLLKNYGVHPKFITETENRLKFTIRREIDKGRSYIFIP